MPQRLRVKRIDTVGFVDKGDNPPAEVVIWKRAPETEAENGAEVGWFGRALLRVAKAMGMDEETALAKLHAMGAVDFETVEAERAMPKVHEQVEDKLASLGSALHRTLEADEDGRAEAMRAAADQFADFVDDAAAQWAGGETVEKQDDGPKATDAKDNDMADVTDTDFDIDALDDNARAYVEQLQKRLDAAEADADDDADEGDIDALEKRIERLEADDADAEVVSVLKDALARAKAADERAEKTEKRLGALEKQRRRERLIQKAEALDGLPGANADDYWQVLGALEDALDEERYTKVEKALTGAAEIVREAEHFNEIGRGGAGEGTVAAEVQAEVEKLRESDPDLTEQTARARVWKSRPDLYNRFERERQARARDR